MQNRKQHLSAAEGYLTLRMPDHALEELEQIENPRLCIVPFYRIKAEALRQQEKFEDSLHAYGRVLAESPRDTEILCGMAWCYKRLGQVGKAIAAAEQAYQAEPDNAMILYNLACYNALAGDRSQALS